MNGTLRERVGDAVHAGVARTWLPLAVQRWRPSMRRRLTILMYHGVVEESLAVPDWCFITARTFRRQMRYLAAHFRVLPLVDAVRALERDDLSGPTVALTFDDGYQNNHDVVLAILREFGFPATVFLVTGLVATSDTLWFCRMNRAVATTRRQALSWRGHEFLLRTRHERAIAAATIQELLKELPHDDFEPAVEDVIARLGARHDRPIPAGSPFRVLDEPSIRAMTASGLIEFGAHTDSHALLGKVQDHDQLRDEIVRSVEHTQRLSSQRCRTFAYPNGRRQDFGPESKCILSDLGIEYAVTTIPGPNTPLTPLLELRRYGIGVDCTDARFQCMLHHFSVRRLLGPLAGMGDA